jgi:hypothetical protein
MSGSGLSVHILKLDFYIIIIRYAGTRFAATAASYLSKYS